VSSTVQTVTWRNSTLFGPYDPDAIRRLKQDIDGGIYISGSGTLVRALLAEALVDELHLCLYPVTRGSGPRLFVDGTPARTWSCAIAERYDSGVLYLKYELQ
jgi:dihydrofolate reductase